MRIHVCLCLFLCIETDGRDVLDLSPVNAIQCFLPSQYWHYRSIPPHLNVTTLLGSAADLPNQSECSAAYHTYRLPSAQNTTNTAQHGETLGQCCSFISDWAGDSELKVVKQGKENIAASLRVIVCILSLHMSCLDIFTAL